MTVEAIITQIVNGLTIGAIIMLIAMGLTIIFGLMDVVNFAHGTMYMLGAYFAATLVARTGHFWLSLIVAPVGVGVLGFLLERGLIRRLYGRDPLLQVLLTFGVAVVLREVIEIIWGPNVQTLLPPPALSGSVNLLGITYPAYRITVLFAAFGIAGATWSVLRWTNIGLIVRAGVRDRDMVDALGIDVRRVFTGVFVAGSMLAAVAGVLVGPLRSVHPDMGNDVIVDAFIAVVVGGLGTIEGAVGGALFVGIAELLGALVIPGMAKAMIYIAVVVVMLVRPTGLFGGSRERQE
jgi:branched-subunit amino acid ABC-type transport system permease component